jgi:hypothetical protein
MTEERSFSAIRKRQSQWIPAGVGMTNKSSGC